MPGTISGILLAQMQSSCRSIEVFRASEHRKGLEFMANGPSATVQTNATSPVVAVLNNVTDGLQAAWSDARDLHSQLIPDALPARVLFKPNLCDIVARDNGGTTYLSLRPRTGALADRDVLALDLLALEYLPYRDFRLWLTSNSAAASQRFTAGA
jgi:hypothetical protein